MPFQLPMTVYMVWLAIFRQEIPSAQSVSQVNYGLELFILTVVGLSMALLLAVINNLGMAVRVELWGSKIIKRSRHYMAFSAKPNACRRGLLSCFIKRSKYSKYER